MSEAARNPASDRGGLRRHWVLLPLALAPLAVLWRALFGGETLFYEDLAAQYFPRELLLSRGGVTGWDPYLFFGVDLLGDPQTAPYEPVRALSRYVGLPATQAYALFLVFWLLVATCGYYRLALRQGARPIGAALTVLVAIWGGAYVVRFHHPWNLPSMCVLPWVALFADRLLERRRVEDGLAIGIGIAVGALGGHPQTPYSTALFVAAYLGAGVWFGSARGDRLRVLWAVAWRAAAGLVAMAGLLAFYYAPVVTSILASARYRSGGLLFAGSFSMPPWQFARLLAPDLFGNDLAGTYFGDGNYHEFFVYLGVAPLLLLIVVAGWRRHVSERPLFATGAGSVVLSIGLGLPLFYVFYFCVPGFRYFRDSCRYLLFAVMCAALVIGRLLSDIERGERPDVDLAARLGRRIRVASRGLAGLLAAAVVAALAWPSMDRLTAPGAHLTVAWAAARGASLFLIAGWCIESWLAGARHGRPTAHALLALTVVDLALQWIPYRQTEPQRGAFPSEVVTNALAEVAPARVWVHALTAEGADPIVPLLDWGEAAGYENVRAYHQTVSGEQLDLLARGDRPDAKSTTGAHLGAGHDPEDWMLDLAGVRRIAVRDLNACPPGWRDLPVIAKGDGYEVLERPHPIPRAWLVSAVELREGASALERLAALDLRHVATVDRDVGLPSEASDDAGEVRPLTWGADEVTLEAIVTRPALLVLSDSFAPGWSAAVNGAPADIVRTDYAFRGVRLLPGVQRVSFRYQVPGLAEGRRITAATLLALSLSMLVVMVRRRREYTRGLPPTDKPT